MLDQKALERIRIRNFSELLDTMRQLGACSLSQITEQMNVGLTTVKKCVNEGLRCGMILMGDTADSTGGRKAQQFLINPVYQYYLIIITDNNDFIFQLYDFREQCVEENRMHFSMPQYYQSLCGGIESFTGRYEVGTIALALPCVVKDGKIMDWYYNPELQGIDIRLRLEQRFGVHVIVQNDMKLTVLGASCGRGEDVTLNLVTAQFGHNGIGVGEMVNGHILEGKSGFAGEVGYTQDIRKSITGTAYLAKIVRNIIICINPEKIIFYQSERQNRFEKIFSEAVQGLPEYAVPEYSVSSEYLQDITAGLFHSINRNGYFKRGGEKNARGSEK